MRTFLPLYAEGMNFRRESDFYAKETENSWQIALQVPGVSKDGLDIEAVTNSLKVSGKKYIPFEEGSTEFTRTFTLPDGVDLEGVKASLRDGILSIKLPKVQEKRPRKIEITSSETEAVLAQ